MNILLLFVSRTEEQKNRMKKNRKLDFLLTCFLALISSNSSSNELNFQDCVNLLGAGMYNRYLENYCDFNGGVGDKLKQLYSLGECRSTVPQEVVDSMAKQVTDDSSSRMKSLGKKRFCAGNKDAYYALTKE
jgi:hypothetical protein